MDAKRCMSAAWLLAAAGCAEPAGEPARAVYAAWPDPLEHLPHGAAQLARVCERSARDSVQDAFCGGPAPTSLTELQARLGVSSEDVARLQNGNPDAHQTSSLAVTGHSTGLGKRSVSAINPRLVLQRTAVPSAAGAPTSRLLMLSFSRGEQLVELVSTGHDDMRLRFYLVAYTQACNADGCTPGDLLTEATERDWNEVSLYDESDLANTVLDCATCHQPDGPGSRKLLRMQELDVPWTHWFMASSEGGQALTDDYLAAHGDEHFGGMTAEQMQRSDPNALSVVVFTHSYGQPNVFDSKQIELEVKESAAALGGRQPFDNSVAGASDTWLSTFERATRGEAIPVPYHNVKITDSAKLAAMTDAYRAHATGQAQQLPDIRAVFPDDPAVQAQLGITTPEGLSGEEVLIAACAQCHNDKLDQSLSRARFRADLRDMSDAERALAIERLQLPADDVRAMPPARLRTLTRDARERAVEALTPR